ncbi:MAG TPA: rhodanese-like domain-containing protein [Stellaceae bacterium]|nr:rhodanese-like domain-containing protein [Stellaceae bacterium]
MFARLLQRLRRSAGGIAWVEANELRRRLRRGDMRMVIDVRGPDEFDGPLGHIPGSLNVPLPALAGRAAQLALVGCPIVLVCLSDKRSAQGAAELVAAGVRDVAVLRGGMKAWRGE